MVTPGTTAPPAGWSNNREALAWFVVDLREALSGELTEHPEVVGSREAADRLLEGLADLDSRAVIETVRDALLNPDRISDDDLEQAGLSGPQLELKLEAYGAARESHRESRGFFGSLRGRFRPGKLFGRLLRRANIIVGSITSIFPLAEAYKEYKELVETVVDEANEDTEPRA